MPLYVIYAIFAVMAVPIFWRLPVRVAILAVLLGGWMLLPVGNYAPVAVGTLFPWWISGIIVPTDMLVTKAWVPPVVALAGAAMRDPGAIAKWRPALIDVPIAIWCLWPLASGTGATFARPSPWIACLYMATTWGTCWLIGRIWFQERAAQFLIAKALAVSAAACLPFALIEGVRRKRLYELIYAPHPFHADGVDRYIGYRPLALFEHGNQYGIWVSLGALAAIWVAVVYRGTRGGRAWSVVAGASVVIAIMAQSVGALALMLAGVAVLALWRSRIVRLALIAGAVAIAGVGALHLSGVVPLQHFARDTAAGNAVLAGFRSVGRGSLTWRVSQDIKTLGAVRASPVTGSGQWDWWRPYGTRPWGLAMLLIGQFGIVGCVLAFGSLAAAAIAALVRSGRNGAWQVQSVALPLAIIVVLALGDALLNAFFYFPALLIAGAIAEKSWRARRADGGVAPDVRGGRR